MCKKSERYYDWMKDLREFAEKYGLILEIDGLTPNKDTVDIRVAKGKHESRYVLNVKYPSYTRGAVAALKSGLIAFWELEPVAKPGLTLSEGELLPSIRNVYFNNPVTVVIWADGTKTIVRCENEEYDPEKGLAMAISKKALGNKGRYFDTFKYWLKRNEEDNNESD